MVKGISRQVILVPSPDKALFDQAIFILNDHILQAFRSIIKKIKKIRQIVRLDPERRGRAAEAAAADLVICGRPLDIEQATSLPQNF